MRAPGRLFLASLLLAASISIARAGTYADIDANSDVTNVVSWDGASNYPLQGGHQLIPYAFPAGIGSTWNGLVFSAPPITSPTPALVASYATQADLSALRSSVIAAIPTDFIGTFARTSLPSATANDGKRVAVTDLGGQNGGFLRASGGCWKRISTTTASAQPVAVATSVTVDGLADSPIIALTGSAFASRATVNVTNACSMPQITVVAPAGVFGTLGSLGVVVGNGTGSATVAGVGTSGIWADYAVSPDGSTLTKIRGGSL